MALQISSCTRTALHTLHYRSAGLGRVLERVDRLTRARGLNLRTFVSCWHGIIFRPHELIMRSRVRRTARAHAYVGVYRLAISRARLSALVNDQLLRVTSGETQTQQFDVEQRTRFHLRLRLVLHCFYDRTRSGGPC